MKLISKYLPPKLVHHGIKYKKKTIIIALIPTRTCEHKLSLFTKLSYALYENIRVRYTMSYKQLFLCSILYHLTICSAEISAAKHMLIYDYIHVCISISMCVFDKRVGKHFVYFCFSLISNCWILGVLMTVLKLSCLLFAF